MDKRSILAIVLALAVIIIYQIFFFKPPVKPPVQEQTKKPTPPAATLASPQPRPVKSIPIPPLPKMGEERSVIVDTPLYRAVFSTRGGALTSFRLKKYRQTLDKQSDLVELVNVKPGMKAPLGISFVDSSLELPDDLFFTPSKNQVQLTGAGTEERLSFSCMLPGRVKLEKVYTFHADNYAVNLELKMRDLSAEPLEQSAVLHWYEYIDPQMIKDDYGHTGPVVYIKGDVKRPQVKKVTEEKVYGPGITWGGFETKYFIAAVIPPVPSLTRMSVGKGNQENELVIKVMGGKTVVPSREEMSFPYRLYLGPKEYKSLKAEGVSLEDAIDFGSWLKWLAMPLLIALNFFNSYIHNYGISIILLTIVIKILFWPLGNKSYKSMKDMQKIQPKLLELREKYKNDKQRLSQETMALYKAYKINPLGGCLPILIQIPVFFGLYKALLYAIELRHAPFFGWIQDLSAKDPYYITPIIMGATMFIQQKMTPMGGDPMQQKIMLWMPVIFTFLFLNFPSGLVIYWLFNNIISIGQQYYITKRHS